MLEGNTVDTLQFQCFRRQDQTPGKVLNSGCLTKSDSRSPSTLSLEIITPTILVLDSGGAAQGVSSVTLLFPGRCSKLEATEP